MTTRKEILVNKYIDFTKQLESIGFADNLFPKLEDIDIVDLLLFFNFFFAFSSSYEETIKGLMLSHSVEVSDEQFQMAMPYITEYIDWLKTFQKTN